MHKPSRLTLPLLLGLYLAVGTASILSAQSEDKYWAMLPDAPTAPEPQHFLPQVPEDYRYARLLPAFRNELEREGSSFSISIPTPDGAFLDFLITPTVVVAPEVAPLYTIKTFKGQAENAPQVRIRCDISSNGFRALVFMKGQGVFVVEPFEKGNSSTHIVYYRDKLQVEPFWCGVEEADHGPVPSGTRAAIPVQKRTYRMAMIADETYRAQFGGMPYMAENVLNSLASGVNMINEVFERDMGVSFALVSNEQCANASIDDHTDLGDIQDFLANSSGLTINGYDIGHSVLWANTGGVAYLRAVCRNAVKGGGFSGNNASFTRLYIDYAAHEIGHQMGANHTFASAECNTSRNNFRFEPGEGSTIMAYAGVCGIGHQNFSDPYLHAASLAEMHNYMSFGAGGSCGTTDNTGNANSPIADARANITIPRETPFVLVGAATDADGDTITYAWQQYDGEGNAQTGLPDCSSNEHPLFRFRPPVRAHYRVFPEMPEVLAGNNNGATWEKLPCAARNMAFRMTVRDNHPDWGRTDFDDATVTVANTGPFAVVVPNGGETWNSDLPQTVTWSVNGTDAHCAEVDILLSTNNGNTFSLLGTFPNTGTAVVTLPPTISFNARILIQCSVGGDFLSASTFFDVSDAPFNLTSDIITFDCFDILADIGEPCENLPFSETVATAALGFPITFAANPTYTITVPDHFSGDYELRLSANGEVFGGSWREEFRVRLTSPDGNNATLDAPGGNADEWRPSGQTSPGELSGNIALGQVSNPAGDWTVEVRLSYNEGPQINATVDLTLTLEPVNVNGIANDECECLPPDCPILLSNIGAPCDDGDPSTSNDAVTADCDCVGQSVIDCEGVAGGNTLPGTACDDGDPSTGNDTYDEDCNCTGLPIDCEGVAGGNALPGTACDDGDPSTGNDTYDEDCNCTGLPIDCEGVAGGNALPGTACDDGDPCTLNEVYDEDCNCTSTGEPALLTVEIQDNPTPAINCTGSPVTLQVSVSNASPDGVAPTWSSPDSGQLVAGTEHSLNPRVSMAGTFVLELTDNSTGCTVSDTIVVALDTLPPLAVAQVDGFIGCTNEIATLDATQSDFGPDIVYAWFSVDLADTVGTDALQPVSAGGFYVLTVLNTATGCSAADSVFVVVDEEVPPVFVSPAQTLTCQRDTVAILASVGLPPGTFSVSWAAQSPAPMPIIEYDTIARITTPGFYEVTVVNNVTGCELTIGREILEDREWPGIALASDGLVLSCVEETAFLEASVDSAHSDLLVYQWQNSEGEHLGTDTTLTVDAPGMYFFQAENTENGCTAIDSVLVSQDVQAPNVVQETTDAFNCLSTEVLLSVAPTGEAADFDLNWSSLTGGTVTPLPSTMTATVNAPGTYELAVTSLANGCDSVVLFEVVADTLPPVGEIAMPSFLGCLGQTVSLDASSFGNNGDFDIEWSSADGQVSLPTGSFLVNVDAPGTYTLSVTNPENGCQTIVPTTVELDPAAPMAVGTTDNNELSCGSTATLDGTGSSEGDHYDYEWANVDGMGALPVPASVLTATVDEPGSYVFIVTNTNTGCADTSAAVAIIPDLNLPTAAAKVDEVGCDDNTFLSANLPAGATGQWTISGTGEIVDPTANATEVIGLGTAPVTLTWTISLENCPDFSSATVVVQPESAPEAQNDQLVVMRGATQGDLNVLANDMVGGGVTFELLTEPALGQVTDFGNGNLSYTLTTTLFGTAQDEFRYRICNANCPERCAEALVRVTIERDKMEIEVPNGITPNGDGINDALVFDQLLLAPDKYPDNELIIFSRWGDIVFKAGPYGNNWQGTNMEGQNLPDGTYYYVLRLDVGSGEIIKGDVTILR